MTIGDDKRPEESGPSVTVDAEPTEGPPDLVLGGQGVYLADGVTLEELSMVVSVAEREKEGRPERKVGRPIGVSEQWDAVQEWYEYLEDNRDSDLPWVDEFNDAWDSIAYKLNGKDIVGRGYDARTSDTVLASLFYYIDMGFYPPPEVLAALKDCWDRYKAACGDLSLEEAFLERPRQGAGNYAKRKNAGFQKMMMQWNFAELLGHGLTRTQAAEAVSQSRGGRPDVESILRMFRGVKPNGRGKPKAAK